MAPLLVVRALASLAVLVFAVLVRGRVAPARRTGFLTGAALAALSWLPSTLWWAFVAFGMPDSADLWLRLALSSAVLVLGDVLFVVGLAMLAAAARGPADSRIVAHEVPTPTHAEDSPGPL